MLFSCVTPDQDLLRDIFLVSIVADCVCVESKIAIRPIICLYNVRYNVFPEVVHWVYVTLIYNSMQKCSYFENKVPAHLIY